MGEQRRVSEAVYSHVVSARVGWAILGFALLAIVAWIGLQYLGWVVFGLFTYYVGRPITHRLRRYVGAGSLAAALTLFFIIAPILLFIAAFLAVALGQALTLLSSDLVASVVERLSLPTAATFPTDPVDVIVVLVQDPTVSTALGQFGLAFGAIATTLFNAFLALLFAFFLLVEDDRLPRWARQNVFGSASLSVEYLRGIDRGLTSVYFGYTLTIFVVIVLSALIYSAFNFLVPAGLQIPFAMLLAVVTGVFTLIPLVGRSIVYAFIVALLSLEALDVDPRLLWIPAVFFVLMVVVFDNVVRTYVRPYLSGKAYHMGLVMFAYLLGPALFGWYGIFLGPLVMVVVVEFVVTVLPEFTSAESVPEASIDEPETVGDRPIDPGESRDDAGETPSD
jgi:predicted PurR-regulated permease PerM